MNSKDCGQPVHSRNLVRYAAHSENYQDKWVHFQSISAVFNFHQASKRMDNSYREEFAPERANSFLQQ